MLLAGEEQFKTIIQGPVTAVSDPQGFENLLSTIIGFLTLIGGITFIFWFMFGAYTWITAGGNAEKLQKAGTSMTNAITGLVILVGAFALTTVIANLLGIDFIFNIPDTVNDLQKTLQGGGQ